MATRRKTDQELLGQLTAESDGRPVRRIGPWSLKKLAVLLLYFDGFTRACAKAGGGFYIDGFAGPGMCSVRNAPPGTALVWGSPLLALQTQPRFERCIFVEHNRATASVLSERTLASAGRREVHNGDANDLVPRILAEDVPGWAPCLCFLDPEALQLQWSTVRAIALTPGRNTLPELLILFPWSMGAQRLLRTKGDMDPTWETKLDGFFPGSEWREVYRDRLASVIEASEANARYLRIYVGGLRTLGYEPDGIFSLAVRTPSLPGGKGRELYHLVFASNHPAGKKIMQYVLQRQNWLERLVMGQGALFAPEA